MKMLNFVMVKSVLLTYSMKRAHFKEEGAYYV